MKKQLYLIYRESRRGGEICAGQEKDAWPSHEPTYTEFSTKSLHLKEPKNSCHTIDYYGYNNLFDKLSKNLEDYIGKILHLVIVRYTTGDTFGCSHGNWVITDVCASYEEAKKTKEDILGNKGYWGKYDDTRKTLGEKAVFHAWHGYFERLEDVEIHNMVLEP